MKQIKLTQGKFALVDDKNFEWLNQWKWHAKKDHTTYYAKRWGRVDSKQKYIAMHRIILNALPGEQVDHQNHNGLDNCERNIRICSHSENQRNQLPMTGGTSKYKGVSWNKRRQKWQVLIYKNGKNVNLGCYENEREAAKIYDKTAKIIYGEFARLNFPNED